MKVKRQKTHRKLMQLYCASFNFREPYQLVVDGTMVHVALQFRIDLRTVVPSTLAAETKLFTTPCIIAELRSLGEDYLGAVLASNRFEARRCGHTKGHLGRTDATLRAHLRSVPGVPLMYLSSSVLVLEPHSPETLECVKDRERAKVHASAKELDKLQKKAEADGAVMPADSARPIGAMPKRKKVKGPNPLAVKKKKKEPTAAAPSSSKDKTKPKQSNQEKRSKESEPAAPSTQQQHTAAAPESSAPNDVPVTTAVTASVPNKAAAPAKRKRDLVDDDEADGPATQSTAATAGSAAKKRRKRGGVRRKKKAAEADVAASGDDPTVSGDDE
ncbi:hypothetical protein AMAG_03983 [Allomyces macrogynus ATCC 38327]|uniref:UTP23 sensor motif region domain-containing protein n=1 Tax=Allomyces macrogynus (strain ATCC 38327) TaxID=578462 RepID=A0A0L0S733_ALLM3|nr:hypothetical protein AMAG_03983 [Allomyces macrogynus ATCC 38327]|eukprot:KNE58408.1 hypothetical protein AMAG_03983 [Allomyces macrogynus ATCC 38327]